VAEAVNPRERRLDLVGAIVVIVIAAFALFVARKEPPAHYDPLGPGTAPTVVALLLLVLGIVLLVRAWSGLRTGQATQSMILGLDGEAPADYRLRPGLAMLCYAATAAYTAALGFGLPFYAATVVFLIGLGAAMADFRRKRTLWVVGVGIVGAFVVKYLFGTVLLVSLP
jgi:hypothetical protein